MVLFPLAGLVVATSTSSLTETATPTPENPFEKKISNCTTTLYSLPRTQGIVARQAVGMSLTTDLTYFFLARKIPRIMTGLILYFPHFETLSKMDDDTFLNYNFLQPALKDEPHNAAEDFAIAANIYSKCPLYQCIDLHKDMNKMVFHKKYARRNKVIQLGNKDREIPKIREPVPCEVQILDINSA
ncbi:hypothetical protein BC940DRAFT_342803 [Gongronella butleri]|nr:hypothetical protein BC940DRAFT_342803 [Gongronella butleri]